ncbi:unnamed protein product [Lampetra fluviatilis]
MVAEEEEEEGPAPSSSRNPRIVPLAFGFCAVVPDVGPLPRIIMLAVLCESVQMSSRLQLRRLSDAETRRAVPSLSDSRHGPFQAEEVTEIIPGNVATRAPAHYPVACVV